MYKNPFDIVRDYTQDLDALILSKPANLNLSMVAMYQDHVGKALLRKGGGGCALSMDQEAEIEDAEETYC